MALKSLELWRLKIVTSSQRTGIAFAILALSIRATRSNSSKNLSIIRIYEESIHVR